MTPVIFQLRTDQIRQGNERADQINRANIAEAIQAAENWMAWTMQGKIPNGYQPPQPPNRVKVVFEEIGGGMLRFDIVEIPDSPVVDMALLIKPRVLPNDVDKVEGPIGKEIPVPEGIPNREIRRWFQGSSEDSIVTYPVGGPPYVAKDGRMFFKFRINFLDTDGTWELIGK